MSAIIKLSVGAAIIGLGILAYRAAKYAIANFDFAIVGYGKPTITNAMVTVPIQIKFKNPTPIAIAIDQLTADIYIKKNNTYVQAAKVNQPLTIAPGTSLQNIYPVINLNSIFGGNFLDTLSSISSILKSKNVNIRTDVTAIFNGIALPKQSFTQDMPLT